MRGILYKNDSYLAKLKFEIKKGATALCDNAILKKLPELFDL